MKNKGTNSKTRILIIGTQPFNKMVQSRAFDSYFKRFDSEDLIQIFSDSRIPCKGHCSKLFQITDKMLVDRRFKKKAKVGHIFDRKDLKDEWETADAKQGFRPRRRGPWFHLARKLIWKKKYWLTNELEQFVSTFNPTHVFISFSKDFFIFDLALYFIKKYNAKPIVSIADDYVFFDEYKKRFLNRYYRKKYFQTLKELFDLDPFCIFESNKIKDKYKLEFDCDGETIYIGSDVTPKKVPPFCLTKDWYYFGNLEYGRFDSIVFIAKTLISFHSSIKVHVYSKDRPSLNKVPSNIVVHKQIPYSSISEKIKDAGAIIIVEGFKNKDVEMVKYSLSTKIGDSMCYGKPIIAFGHPDSGAMSFLAETKTAYVSTDNDSLRKTIHKILSGYNDFSIYENQYRIANNYFSVNKQSDRFFDLFTGASDENSSD